MRDSINLLRIQSVFLSVSFFSVMSLYVSVLWLFLILFCFSNIHVGSLFFIFVLYLFFLFPSNAFYLFYLFYSCCSVIFWILFCFFIVFCLCLDLLIVWYLDLLIVWFQFTTASINTNRALATVRTKPEHSICCPRNVNIGLLPIPAGTVGHGWERKMACCMPCWPDVDQDKLNFNLHSSGMAHAWTRAAAF